MVSKHVSPTPTQPHIRPPPSSPSPHSLSTLHKSLLSHQPPFPRSTTLHTSLPPRLKRQSNHQNPTNNKQRSANINRRRRLQISEHGDNRRHNAEDAVCRCRNGVARAPVLCREDFRRVGVEDRVHDVGHEVVGTVPAWGLEFEWVNGGGIRGSVRRKDIRDLPPKQRRRIQRRRGAKEENACQNSRQGERPLPPHIRRLHQKPTKQTPRHPQTSNDKTVAVGKVR